MMQFEDQMDDDETEIKNPKHAESFIASLQSLWENGELCDMTLKVGDSLFKAHKLVLVSQSKYFKNMLLQGCFVEANENLVDLEETEPEYFEKILKYFYYGRIIVSMKDIEKVMKLADYFLIDSLKMFSAEYLQKKIDKQNCIWQLLLPDKYKLNDEHQFQILEFISTNIEEVSKTDEFCKLSRNKVVEILNHSANDGCSENLFVAIFDWIQHDNDNRKDFIFEFVKILSPRGLKQSFLMETLLNEPLIRNNSDCNMWLLDRIRERFASNTSNCNENANALFLADPEKNVSYSFDISSRAYTTLNARPKDISGFCVCSYKDNVFLLGGEYEGKAFNKSMKINSGKQEWEELNWDFNRRDAAACVVSNEIYIIGGYNIEQKTALNTFHVCDLETGKQIRLRDMVQKRRYPGLCTYGGILYACCGEDGEKALNTVEKYDPREGFWGIHATLSNFSGSCSAAILDDRIFICKTRMGNIRPDVQNTLFSSSAVQLFELQTKCSTEFLKSYQMCPDWNCAIGDKLFYVESNTIHARDKWQLNGTGNYNIRGLPNDLSNARIIIVPWEKDNC